MGAKFDFSGWATKNGLRCADGRVIMRDAFKHADGQKVPLVWGHQHNSVSQVLGHALLENRDEGVYAYGYFNESEAGKNAKLLVQHGDVDSMSIFANQLEQIGPEVVHGVIREVSLVLSGANPGAKIENVVLAHSDMVLEEEAIISTGITFEHSGLTEEEEEEKEETSIEDNDGEENDEMSDSIEHSADGKEKTVGDVWESMTEEQKMVSYALIGKALEKKGGKDNENEDEEDEKMQHNAFAEDHDEIDKNVLMHDAMATIIADGKRFGTLKESFLAHADEYGITNIDWLFPEAKNLTDKPGFIKRNPDGWVSIVMNGVHHTPFSRIKMMFADLREDDARAKGYAQKGKLKKEEVFGLLKRTVEPTTVYKKQKLDRDDVIDINDFDVIAWMKGEMRMMLDEELARAFLFGDGRSASSEDKIDASKIIPIAYDAPLYTINYPVASNVSAADLIDACVKAQDNYEGSGNTTMFVANNVVTDMLLIKDLNQRRIYNTVNDLALACSVNRIVKVPAAIIPAGIKALIVDLSDYNVGADKGGSVNMFDDFDIDYNQMKYLIETRCSGALTKPFSAIVIKDAEAAG